MNPSNKKLLNGIKIFFKTLYIIVLVFFIIAVLSTTLALVAKNSEIGAIPLIYVDHEPDLNLAVSGKPIVATDIFTIGVVNVNGAPFGIRFICALISVLTIFCFVVILRKVRGIIRSINQNEIFTLVNAARLRMIGWILLAVFLMSNSLLLFGNINTEEFTLQGKFMAFIMIFGDSLGILVSMVFTFFMAAVFKIGVNMQEENKSFV